MSGPIISSREIQEGQLLEAKTKLNRQWRCNADLSEPIPILTPEWNEGIRRITKQHSQNTEGGISVKADCPWTLVKKHNVCHYIQAMVISKTDCQSSSNNEKNNIIHTTWNIYQMFKDKTAILINW